MIINHNEHKNQLPEEIKIAFKELKVLAHLKNAGFKKRFGFTCSYLFQIVFTLIFHHKNWFCISESSNGKISWKRCNLSFYKSHPGFAWRRFLSGLSSDTIQTVANLTYL